MLSELLEVRRRREQALRAQEEVRPRPPPTPYKCDRIRQRRVGSRVENAKFDDPPSGFIPAATAIASSSVDLPLPFSPIK
jgi:hypothetical protein